MLMGVGLSMGKGGAVIPYPETLMGLEAWFKQNAKQIGADGGRTHNQDLSDGEKITKWDEYTAKGYYLGNVEADAPAFETDDNTLEFSGNSYWLNLHTKDGSDHQFTFEGDFSLIMRLRFTTTLNDSLFGDNTQDFFRLTNSKSFRAKIGSTHQNNFTESTDEIDSGAGAPYYCVMFSRDDGACSVYVDGGHYSDKKWGGVSRLDNDLCSLSNIGAQGDDVQNLGANVKDVLIYSTSIKTADRQNLFAYLHAQPNE